MYPRINNRFCLSGFHCFGKLKYVTDTVKDEGIVAEHGIATPFMKLMFGKPGLRAQDDVGVKVKAVPLAK